jgi:uncharacterized protein YjbI with pentapeptide repeats
MTEIPTLERLALDPSERRQLLDASRYGSRCALALAGRQLSDLEVFNLTWSDSWASALVERATFSDCRFVGHDLTTARFADVTFERCTFEGCRLDRTSFEHCRFVACSLTEGLARDTTLQDCSFVDSTLALLMLNQVRFDGVRLDACVVREVRFSRCLVNRLELADTKWRQSG